MDCISLDIEFHGGLWICCAIFLLENDFQRPPWNLILSRNHFNQNLACNWLDAWNQNESKTNWKISLACKNVRTPGL